ncbi:MAG: hypothetical protein FWC89_12285 [Defluviitaleaceae bacterium]|nr:hypothetical protein [Defluviitaleaceae bacterium]
MLPSLGIESWKVEKLSNLVEKIKNLAPNPLIFIDGKAGSGKSSLAAKLAEVLDANLVTADDIAWHLDFIHWDDELLNGIIYMWQNGKNVAYRPSGWVKNNREGSIKVVPNKPLVIEGCGTCRKRLREIATYSIWVDTDPNLARERVIQRDLANGENGGTLESVTKFTDWCDSIIDPFLEQEKAWLFTNIIVSGSKSKLTSNVIMIHELHNTQKLIMGDTAFDIKLAQIRACFVDASSNSKPEDSFAWVIDIEAEGRFYNEELVFEYGYDEDEIDYDGEHYNTHLYSEGFPLDSKSWKDLEGKTIVWDNFDSKNGIHAGQCLFHYHQSISTAKLEILERRGSKFYVRYTGIIDAHPDNTFFFEGEVDCVIWATTRSIRNIDELMPVLAEYINIEEVKLKSEHKDAISCVWYFSPIE